MAAGECPTLAVDVFRRDRMAGNTRREALRAQALLRRCDDAGRLADSYATRYGLMARDALVRAASSDERTDALQGAGSCLQLRQTMSDTQRWSRIVCGRTTYCATTLAGRSRVATGVRLEMITRSYKRK